jgi:predicted Rossmann fold nucleotide-binding protein DprA/Smf involved in DNA uptake
MADMPVSPDSQAVLLLCSHLGLPPGSAPLTPREWNDLAGQIHESPLRRPAALLDLSESDVAGQLGVPPELAARLRRLLDRGAALASELERLEALGIWTVTRADDSYPARYRERLNTAAPPVLFGSGRLALAGEPGLAVVGSRNADETAIDAAEFAGSACAASGLVTYSGGAKGVDGRAMGAALEAGGRVVGVLADNLERAVRAPAHREAIADGRLTLLSPYSPKAPFNVGSAMGRNKLIYTLADYALVVASEAESGGTWAGATEALKAGWVPVYVCDGPALPKGNQLLLRRGGVPFPHPFPGRPAALGDWLAANARRQPIQPTLF